MNDVAKSERFLSWGRARTVGKRYLPELEMLPQTYEWAFSAPIGRLTDAVRGMLDYPLLAVGSGGSFTSAVFASFVHQLATGRTASPMTPLEVMLTSVNLRDLAILILTAGGGNPDVLAAFDHVVRHEPRSFGVLCTRLRTPLSRQSKGLSAINVMEFDLPAGKDGFLATNSLLATCVLLTRAYSAATNGRIPDLPTSFSGLIGEGAGVESSLEGLRTQAATLWKRQTLVVLHGPTSRAAAVDLESKFTEAALGNIQIADYRNFAHGRHHWLARYGDESGVIGFVSSEDRQIADKTLRLIPDDVPVLKLQLPDEPVHSALAAIVLALRLVGEAGIARGVDPGKPSIPQFGRKIYHLRAFNGRQDAQMALSPAAAVCIERKAGRPLPLLHQTGGDLSTWRKAFVEFITSISQTDFNAAIFDYDGTLCGPDERFTILRKEIVSRLRELLKAGIPIGIATGRGCSVRESLRASLEKKAWPRVTVGYYNGGQIGTLADDLPDNRATAARGLGAAHKAVLANRHLLAIADLEVRQNQMSLSAKAGTRLQDLWELVQHSLGKDSPLHVYRSDHSVDVLAPHTSKRAVLERVRQQLAPGAVVLSIGDKGRWPGNDCELLQEPFSLSVDEVSSIPSTCWNLAPPGVRGVEALLKYFDCMTIHRERLSVDFLHLIPGSKK